MTLADSNHSKPNRGRIDPERLKAANLHPETGLATDYLNRFNEAVMLLELVSDDPSFIDDPSCIEELYAWEPADYVQHFLFSSFKARDLAIEAYHQAPLVLRRRLGELANSMTSLIVAAREALIVGMPVEESRAVVEMTLSSLKEHLAEASAVIHGKPLQEAELASETQNEVDALLAG